MKLLLKREPNALGTPGRLYIDGVYECDTLEDVVRDDGVKIYGETAIPFGVYPVKITYSPRFKQMLPLVENVPNFTGIRFHPGNTVADTEGCILVGKVFANQIQPGSSRPAFNKLMAKMVKAIAQGESIELTVALEA